MLHLSTAVKKSIEIIINLFFLAYMEIQVFLILQEFSKKKPTKWMHYYTGIITVLLAVSIIFIGWMLLFGVIPIKHQNTW